MLRNERSPKPGGVGPVTSREAVIVVLLLICGLAARWWRISGVTLDHFDEAVYAYSALGVSGAPQAHVLYPQQAIFSPPFYFGLGGMLVRLFGVTPETALLALSIIFGTLTIVAVWWIGRSGFGIGAGVAAATIVALNPFHITFSRVALTDVTFTFLLLCALAALVVAIERASMAWGVLGGLITGFAWNTKYHGWFALLITGAALVPYCWSLRRDRVRWRHVVSPWLAASVTAFLCYLPWLLYLRAGPGGYGGMARHYQGMLRTDMWLYDFGRYAQMLAYLEHPIGRIAVVLALLFAVLLSVARPTSLRRTLLLFGGVALSSLVLGSAGTTLLVTMAAIPFLLRGRVPFRVWVLLGTIALWLVSAPLYRPYARLLLPYTIATALGAGIGLAAAVRYLQSDGGVVISRRQWRWVGMLAIATAAICFLVPTPARIWPRERGMRAVADSMGQLMPVGSRLIAVLDPPVGYYLQRSRGALFEPVAGFAVFDTLSRPAYVVTGGYVRRSPKLRQQIALREAQLQPVRGFSYQPSDVRLLDDMNPSRARQYRARPDSAFNLWLFRYVP